MPRRSLKSQPKVAVVTVSYGSGEVLETFLTSLRRFHGGRVTVVVVDNKPDHDSVRALASRFDALYLPLENNPGYGAGMNAGVRLLSQPDKAVRKLAPDGFDAFFFCNPDVRFIEPAIDGLAAALFDRPRAGAIGPRMLNEDGTVYSSARNVPSLSTGIGHAIFGKIWKNNPWSRAYTAAANYDASRASGWLSGAAVMVRADVYHELDGWDDDYFMYFEDVDLGYRIGLAGYENRYEPSVALEHTGAHSTRGRAKAVEKSMTDSAVRFMRKRYPGLLRTPLRWGIVLGLRLRGWLRVRSAK